MLHLVNEQLRVSVLDPEVDRARLGSRYCWGGYIYQVSDTVLGDLLSGPRFPAPEPPVFDGQGLPEAFEVALGQENVEVGEEVAVIGVGRVLRSSPVSPFHVRDNPEVTHALKWEIQLSSARVEMLAEQEFKSWSLQIRKIVSLEDRVLRSTTEVRNSGDSFSLRWFAHPFFPLGQELSGCRPSIDFKLPDNPGYTTGQDGFLIMDRNYSWELGNFQPIEMEWGKKVSVSQLHPRLGTVECDCDFPLAWMPVWANHRTFSFEPYVDRKMGTGETYSWSMVYHF